MSTSTRYTIRLTKDDGQVWWIHRLAPLTNPSWSERRRDAKTWASRSGARENAKRYRLDTLDGFEIVEVSTVAAVRR